MEAEEGLLPTSEEELAEALSTAAAICSGVTPVALGSLDNCWTVMVVLPAEAEMVTTT